MGYHHKLSSWTHFWSNEPDLSVPFASPVMPRNRLAETLSHLPVNDDLLLPKDNTDRLYILHLLIKSLNKRYVKFCSKQVSIGESKYILKEEVSENNITQ